MSHVFHRAADPIKAVRAEGVWVFDAAGNSYLDGAGGAIVSSVGHGNPEVVAALESARELDYVHPSVFTSDQLESYASRLATHVPVADVRIFPTSGGAESVETAIKLARTYHLAMGEPDRDIVISRRMSYHGNTIGALDLSGRNHLRAPYEGWLGRSQRVPEVAEYRCPNPGHPVGCAEWHAEQLDRVIQAQGAHRVAAFVAEAVGGATLGVSVPPDEYWSAVSEVCRRHGVLLIVDEIMTGFGRTGHWFAVDRWRVEPDIIVSGKGAAGGYWPLGLCMASGEIHRAVLDGGGFTHGFTFSHSPIGAAVGMAVLEQLESRDLVGAAARMGAELLGQLDESLADVPAVGEVRGIGLLIGVEFVADRGTKRPFARDSRIAEQVTSLARDEGLLVYPSSGCADGSTGDSVLLGPPLSISPDEVAMIVERLNRAIARIVT